jgi:ParB-like chromosome segregation protein Spo0J
MASSKTASKPRDPFARFALIPIDYLLPHEEIVPDRAIEVMRDIKEQEKVFEPILVSEGSWVVLNGHHRLEALRRLGATKVPVWLVDYDHSAITVELWPEAKVKRTSKKAIIARARKGKLYPPKTSRHKILKKLPQRTTPLSKLL